MMKLSEAIRLGATTRPQIYGRYRSSEGTCAFGAAFEAAGNIGLETILVADWPEEFAAWKIAVKRTFGIACPECGFETFSAIPHLNDTHQWTRERIADYVEMIELESSPTLLGDNADVVADTVLASQAK